MTAARAAWLIVAIGFVVNALGAAGRNLLGLALPELQAELGWSRSTISAGATLAFLLMGAGGLYAGWVLGRYGPARLLALGVAMAGGGLVLTGFVQSAWQYLAVFGVMVGAGFGLSAIGVVSSTVAPHFTARRGLALGIAAAGGTLGPVVLIPLTAVLIGYVGWRGGFIALGLVCLACAPFIYAGLRRTTGAGTHPLAFRTELRGLLENPVFHLLFWGFLVCGVTSIGVIETHFLPYASACGFAPITGANAFGVLSFFNLIGVLIAGWLADKVNRPLLLAGLYVLRGLTFILLVNIGTDPQKLFLFAVLFGLVDYATAPIVASLVASHLGLRVMGVAMGLIGMAHQLGAAIGALGGGLVFDMARDYAALWLLSLALAIVAGAVSVFIKPRPA